MDISRVMHSGYFAQVKLKVIGDRLWFNFLATIMRNTNSPSNAHHFSGSQSGILMALSMSVVTSMIAVPGLRQMVLQGVGRLDVGIDSCGGRIRNCFVGNYVRLTDSSDRQSPLAPFQIKTMN